jgi:thiol-disulfide isomerase/thioredoxin
MNGVPNASTVANANPAPARGPIAPDIVSDTWLNSPPLSAEQLRGKVVLVEFWTFDCINCRNTISYIRALYEKYRDRGLVVVGVHTPELSFERELANVKAAIKDQNIAYPVAIDNDSKNWNAFNVWAWPTWFILDKQGAIRFTHVGEGAYAESEQIITQLLEE